MTHIERFEGMSEGAKMRYCEDVENALNETNSSIDSVLNF